MPLIKGKSKEAFKHNVKAEMDAGKPMKQSLAIAYATKRKAPKKKMAIGGRVDPDKDLITIKDKTGRTLSQSEMEKSRKRKDSKSDPKGIHMPANSNQNYPHESEVGEAIRTGYMKDRVKEEHRKKLDELKALKPANIEGLAFGGDVQDDVNEVFERDPIDHDSMSDSTQFGPPHERKGSNLPLNIKTQQDESVFEPDDDKHAMADREGFAKGGMAYCAEGGSIPEPELKNVNARSALGDHVEMLVDKMLEMKFGNKEAEHFADAGFIGLPSEQRKQQLQDYFKKPQTSPSPDSSPDYQRPAGGDAYDRAHDKLMNDLDRQYGPSKGYSYGGKIEDLVNKAIDKKMMAQGGMIPENYRYHNDPKDQSATGPDDESNHMDDDILSEDDYMNDNMDHEDSMEPKKKKNLMASILAEVRKHNMGK